MARSSIRLNHATVQAYLDGGFGVAAMVRGEAEQVASRAKSSAPVDTGAYRDSIHLEDDHTDRLVVRVVADVDYALAIEAETGNLARSL